MATLVEPRSSMARADTDVGGRDASREPLGLSSAEAERRLAQFGPNEIRRESAVSPFILVARQFASPLIWLLLAASVLSGALGELLDAVAIGAIVIVNAVIGFVQEHRAERAVMALRSMTAPRSRVIRDGHSVIIPAAASVPGDVLVLEAGDVAAADARLRTAHALTTNEAPLTGESTPVDKTTTPTGPDTPLAERHDFVFMGTSVSTGTGLAEVVATGMQTELGRIAHLLSAAEESITPLQRRLARVSQTLLYICGGIVAVVALAGLLRGWPLMQVFMAAVSLAVAGVPEGLPAVVTIALAVGVQRMAARHVLIRRLPAVETLGCATVVCTDKTGTLTTGVMRVRELWGIDHTKLLLAAASCCDAEIRSDANTGVGDPTEVAILMAAAQRGIHRDEIERANARITESPFDSVLKRMAIERADGQVYVKGAVESVLPLCVKDVGDAAQTNAQMAERGLRILAVAVAPTSTEQGATLIGLIGIADPPRTEAIEAVAAARAAGITTVMITGDPILRCPADRPDMIVGEVKEGAARLNPAMRNPVVIEVALARFGCSPPEDAPALARQLLAQGHATTVAGHSIRMIAFGDIPDTDRQGPWTTVPMGHIVHFLRSYLKEHWDVLRHAQIRDPALGMLALMEKLRLNAPVERSPINRQKERANGGVRMHRRS